jgi:mono/diheme cytochrome c family protein
VLARAWCAKCRAVERGAQPPFAGVPSIVEVANMPSTTAASLHAFLATPHTGDMPALKLEAEELDAIVAYVLSLKDR